VQANLQRLREKLLQHKKSCDKLFSDLGITSRDISNGVYDFRFEDGETSTRLMDDVVPGYAGGIWAGKTVADLFKDVMVDKTHVKFTDGSAQLAPAIFTSMEQDYRLDLSVGIRLRMKSCIRF